MRNTGFYCNKHLRNFFKAVRLVSIILKRFNAWKVLGLELDAAKILTANKDKWRKGNFPLKDETCLYYPVLKL